MKNNNQTIQKKTKPLKKGQTWRFSVVSSMCTSVHFSDPQNEADKIGLYLMAIAGYNPDEAAELWKRMKANSGGQAPPEFLSTHPSNDTRIANLKAWSPRAKAEAKKFGKVYNLHVVCAYGGGSMYEQQKACAESPEIIVCTPGMYIGTAALLLYHVD